MHKNAASVSLCLRGYSDSLINMRAQDLLESWPMGLMGLFQAQVERAKYASVSYELDHVVDIDLFFFCQIIQVWICRLSIKQ